MKNSKLTQTIFIGLFAALIAVCSQIQIPGAVPFTLQTFAVFLAGGLLGGKRGTISVIVYILLGAVGLPVFAGFKGGIGALIGTTGGYIIGFIFSMLVFVVFELLLKEKAKKIIPLGIAMVIGLIICYAFGTAWFMIVYTNTKEPIGLITALSWCVFPFIIPDIVKIALALTLTSRLKRFIPF
ncbi:MAG: biotin transporter BioY [Lachnospiraceae bacterium]|nr:biotin transporter BioY [Lachnospiraceae bacterium]